MARIYSSKFFDTVVPDHVFVNCFTVPAGDVYVVRDICAINVAGLSDGLGGFYVYDGSTYMWAVLSPQARRSQLYHWEGRQVFEGLDTLAVYGLEPGWGFRMSGYNLTP